VVLVAAAFDQDVSLSFIDDGVYQLVEGQNPEGIGMKNFSKTFHAQYIQSNPPNTYTLVYRIHTI
jgi:sulfur relay (sulfurtransferase) DsrF/TusC family protein